MSGVLLLSVSTVAVKVIGLAFKIPMLSLLGTEGMGYFNSAYEIYALLCVISTAGLPIALSILVSSAIAKKDYARVTRVYRSAKLIFFLLGMLGTLIMLFCSKLLSDFIGNSDAYLCIAAISPALLLVCLSSAVRGYTQGFGYMTPTAVSQLIEAVGKLVFGVTFALLALKKNMSLPTAAAFAVFGISVGTLLSLFYLFLAKKSDRLLLPHDMCADEADGKHRNVALELISIALPITLGSAVIGSTRIIDMSLIMRRLQDIGVSAAESNSIYGAYTTLALPVFSLIPSLITPISLSLVPQLSGLCAKKNKEGQRNVLENSLRFTSLLAMPSSLAVTLFSRQILELIFPGQIEAVNICTPLLSLLGGSILFSCLITTTNAILQAYRKTILPIISMCIGVIVKLVSSYILIGIPAISASGAPIGSFLCNVVVTFLNIFFIVKYVKVQIRASAALFKPLGASIVAVGGAYFLFGLLNVKPGGSIAFLVTVIAAIVIYILACILLGCISKDDIDMILHSKKQKSDKRVGNE